MSKYHIKCTETDVPPKKKKKEPAEVILKENQGSIVESLAPAEEKSYLNDLNDILAGVFHKRDYSVAAEAEPPREVDSLLATINPNLPCCCEVMARAIRDDLPKILGMSSHRAALQLGKDDLLDCDPDIKFDDPGGSTTNNSEKPCCAKPPNRK